MRALFALLVVLMLALPAFALDTAPAFDDPAQQERYQRIIRELRCLQCRSESIADSGVTLAADLRRQVREMMAAGKSDQEIFQHMVDRYGDYVLYKPPVTPRTWLLWAAPVLLLVVGATAAGFVIARKSKLPDTDPADPGLGAS
ncbi:MAG TPA: cytochrome c-type biogenesis protein [Steroidobacteraceae bacterium]|jgi:cytochrome c-type biogenesis protein CcmH|nr:cytochrome c-type biogenesis protein [Steroidobacteraceae bacterium]